jgi:hypothetical protein
MTAHMTVSILLLSLDCSLISPGFFNLAISILVSSMSFHGFINNLILLVINLYYVDELQAVYPVCLTIHLLKDTLLLPV